MTAENLAPLVSDLRRIVRSDLLWLYTTLPSGAAWVAASGTAAGVRDRPPEGLETLRSATGPRPIPRQALPDGWRAGVLAPIRAPDGRDAGCLLLGWTRRSGRYLARWITSGRLGGAVTGATDVLGAFWAKTWTAHVLEAERSRLRTVIDHSNVCVLALDQNGKIVVWNAAMSELVGVRAEDAVGRRPEELFTLTGEDGRAVCLAAGLHGSVRLTTPGGRSLWTRVSCSAPARATPAAASGLLCAAFVDESAQRQVEYMRHLLTLSVRHELHGPLTTIRGHCQLLAEILPDDENTADSLGAIQDAVEMMRHVIGDLVQLVGPDPAAPPATRAEPVQVEPLLRRTLRSIPSVAARGLVAAAPGLTVRGDPVRLRQCLLLVLGNAEKYAPDGTIEITAYREGTSGVISVADRGPGIPSRERDLVLRPRYRSEATRDLPGSGMGLYITATVMTAMNGRLELAPAPSGGLEVRLRLPLWADPHHAT
ncbi:ATP-binding protein [Actinomadura sp. NPDC047616]|uniref:PAS domain-containing sensor histidine kinase n=1 Tax=Actinomadura sp. NPDC047616 TaxID=3155914 RepID=UPI0033F5A6F1